MMEEVGGEDALSCHVTIGDGVGGYPQETQAPHMFPTHPTTRRTSLSRGNRRATAHKKRAGQKGRRKRSPLARAEIVKYGCSKPSFKQKRVGIRKHGHSVCGAYYAPMRKSSHRGGVNLTIGIGRQDEEWEAGSTRVLVEV